MPEYLDVRAKLSVNFPGSDVKLRKNIQHEDRAKASVNANRCDGASNAYRRLDLGFKGYRKLLDIDALVEFELEQHLTAKSNLNLQRYGNYPNYVL